MRPDTSIPSPVAIIGAGRSGVATARFLLDRGIGVFISDACAREKLEKTLAEAGLAQVAHEAGAHTERILEARAIVLSPGVRSDLDILVRARLRAIPVWSEMEFGYRMSTAQFLAVTGSSGKSTTVSMLGEIMKAAGRPTVVAGNIGVPVITLAPPLPAGGVVAAEVSSFQLETIDTFKPAVAVILNLLKNHLDRYDSAQEYFDAKKQIARNMDGGCSLVLNACDPLLVDWAPKVAGGTSVVWFGAMMAGSRSVWPEGTRLMQGGDRKTETVADLSSMVLRGPHNRMNAAAAAAVALCAGAAGDAVERGVCGFRGLAHRLQFAGAVDGVEYFNDSKSTTAESIECAVTAFGRNVHLIAGGRDKGCDFSVVNESLKKHVKQVVAIGEAAGRIEKLWGGVVPVARAASLEAAVAAARARAVRGDVVVLSPGCSSFDMFKNFEERGEVFMRIVGNMTKERGV